MCRRNCPCKNERFKQSRRICAHAIASTYALFLESVEPVLLPLTGHAGNPFSGGEFLADAFYDFIRRCGPKPAPLPLRFHRVHTAAVRTPVSFYKNLPCEPSDISSDKSMFPYFEISATQTTVGSFPRVGGAFLK